jgi:predicted ATPase
MAATHGYASAEVQHAFARARELTHIHTEPCQTIPVLFGLSVFYLVSGKFDQAIEEGNRLLALAEKMGDEGYRLAAHLAMGASNVYLGNYFEARSHLEQAIIYADPQVHLEYVWSQGQDPSVAALSFLSLVLWIQGYPHQAIAAKEKAAALAQQINHPHTIAYASSIAATLSQKLRAAEECERCAAITLAASKGRFPLWHATAEMAQGWLMTHRGGAEAGVAAMKPGLALWEGTGAHATAPYFRARLAEAYLAGGMREEGLQVLDEAICHADQAWWLPEEYRLRAELLLLEPGSEEEAAECLQKGIEIARKQQAKSLELRLCMSFARLHHRQGRTMEGHDLLADCYSWFREGFETLDLREARELLAELASCVITNIAPTSKDNLPRPASHERGIARTPTRPQKVVSLL